MILDFTITTCLRPDILRRTLESFRENLRGVEWGKCTAYMNIDPVGETNWDAMTQWLPGYFDKVVINSPKVASFPAAVKWCFAQPTTEYAFHLEDDWLLTEPIEIAQMLAVMHDEGRKVVNLRAHDFRAGIRRCFLSPGLWRGEFMREVGEAMDGVTNPEVNLWRLTDRLQAGRYWPDRIVVQDIGRAWLSSSGYAKDIETQRGVNPWTKWKQK